jgi:hypothetical protein
MVVVVTMVIIIGIGSGTTIRPLRPGSAFSLILLA